MPTPTRNTIEPPAPLIDDPAAIWGLDPSIDFLNHGCFGARTRAVSDAQDRWRRRFESRPVEVLERCRDAELDRAKTPIGRFIGADLADFGFVTNATDGCNAVLRSMQLEPGDELLATNHGYNAIAQTARYVTRRTGARVVTVDIPLPIAGPDAVVDAVESGLGERTRLVIVDHVASPTAVVFPVQRIIERCAARGIDVLVDGVHVPGMLELDVSSLGAAYYTGNFHKWLGAPLGSAFLWVRPDRQDRVHPNVISHFLDEGFAKEFRWQGTRDISPWLCAADAVELGAELGWDRIRRHNHELAVWVQTLLCERWGCEPSTPIDGSMLGSMVTLPLPGDPRSRHDTPDSMTAALHDDHRIEVPVMEWRDRWWLRASCQLYNKPAQYERLAEVILEMVRS